MKSILSKSLLAVIGLFAASLPTQAETPDGKISVPNLFSYQPPETWIVQTFPNATYPAATKSEDGEVQAIITVEVDHKPGPLNEWCEKSLAKNKTEFSQYDFHAGEVTPFVTAAGVKGFRVIITLVANAKSLNFVDYFFAGGSDAKLVVSCTCPAEKATHYSPIFDAALKTFVPQ